MINEIACSDGIDGVDLAKLSFAFPSSSSGVGGGELQYAVYGVNHDCYECSWTLLTSQLQNQCVTLSTTFGWDLYLAFTPTETATSSSSSSSSRRSVLAATGEPLQVLSHLFKERGEYTIHVDGTTSTMSIEQTKDGIDSLLPLY